LPDSPAIRQHDTAAEILTRISRTLGIAKDQLAEVDSIGLWSKSDDSSDSRRKREGLREAGSSISYAGRTLKEADLPALRPIAAALAEFEAMVAPLAGMVTDTMGTSHDLDYRLSRARTKAAELLELIESHRGTELN
jgi:hypothetical protein